MQKSTRGWQSQASVVEVQAQLVAVGQQVHPNMTVLPVEVVAMAGLGTRGESGLGACAPQAHSGLEEWTHGGG
ncbi:MAG: hypothetical protein IT368_09605 [Candidatus Hydrogenedentes bacterium]|nr:hypothetical protein [Candidatus Hydrogenedentota bacterium]